MIQLSFCFLLLQIATSTALFLNPTVPLSHCVRLGLEGEFWFEWRLSLEPRNTVELRYTSDIQRGFSSLGFSHGLFFQLVTGHPEENLKCARQLFDNYSPFDVDGNAYPNFPEVPGKLVWTNTTHVSHYLMRNLSVTARHLLHGGGSRTTTNVTVMWGYQQASMFRSGCYGAVVPTVTEQAQYDIVLTDDRYLGTPSTTCHRFLDGQPDRYLKRPKFVNGKQILDGELQQNVRVAALLVGGQMMVESGFHPPLFNGRVYAGTGEYVCSNSLTEVFATWHGFSDAIGGITKYEVSVGTKQKPTMHADHYGAGTNLAVRLVARLEPNSSYVVKVQAFNFAGLSTTAESKPVLVLNGGIPLFGKMYDGYSMGTSNRFQRSSSELQAVWGKWLADEHSTRNYLTNTRTDNGYSYAVWDFTDQMHITPFTVSPTFATSISIGGLSLLSGRKYGVTIRATNCAAALTTQTSPGVTVDAVPPVPGSIFMGNVSNVHKSTIRLGDLLTVSWSGWVDHLSGIADYEWSVSIFSVPPALPRHMLKPWQSVGHALRGRNTTLARLGSSELSIGDTIFCHVRATDGVGNSVESSVGATLIAN